MISTPCTKLGTPSSRESSAPRTQADPLNALSQTTVTFGDAVVSTGDTCIGVEMCEELFTPGAYVLSLARRCFFR